MTQAEPAKVAVVTGASAGIGRSTARMLAQQGWHVIGVGRDPGRTAEAEAEIKASAAPGARVDFLRGDFNVMADVKRVAGEIAALTGHIDVLINNAGGVRDDRYVTLDGLEATFAANHLAPFLLTRELMPLLKAAASARVLAVSSSGHEYCSGMNWDDLQFENDFTTGGAYCQAKLANLLFTRELDRRIASDGMTAQAMHPGRVASNFASHGDQMMQSYMATANNIAPDQPAQTLVWMATAPETGAPGARYFHEMQQVPTAPQALDDAAAARLWQESEAILAQLGV